VCWLNTGSPHSLLKGKFSPDFFETSAWAMPKLKPHMMSSVKRKIFTIAKSFIINTLISCRHIPIAENMKFCIIASSWDFIIPVRKI